MFQLRKLCRGQSAEGQGVKPYYSESSVTIYHSDCREVLPGLSADAVLADPPYNVGKDYGDHDDSQSGEDYEAWLREILALCAGAAPEVVFFPGTKNVLRVESLLEGTGLRPYRMLGWHKREFAGDKWCGGPAMCWEPVVWATRSEKPRYEKLFGTYGRDFLAVNATHGDPYAKLHPCPKPLVVMKWLVGLFVPEGGTVLDPFVGTGTTLEAAKVMGRRAIGIELEEKHCATAVRRVGQEVLDYGEAA